MPTGITNSILVGVALAVGLSCLVTVRSVAADSVTYAMKDIGSLPGAENRGFSGFDNIFPRAINNAGAVAATARPLDDSFRAVPFTSFDDDVTRLGDGRGYDLANDINDEGQVVGLVTDEDDTDFRSSSAVIWRDGKTLPLGPLGDGSSFADAINNHGIAVGYSTVDSDSGSHEHAVMWDSSNRPQDLGTLGGESSTALGVSDSGLVVGFSEVADRPRSFPFLWQGGVMTELPVLEAFSGFAEAVNDHGVIVGIAVDFDFGDRVYSAHRWIDQNAEILPPLIEGGQAGAVDVNRTGDIVGWSDTEIGNPETLHAVVWRHGQVTDLNDQLTEPTNWTLRSAKGVNDAGQIVATALVPGEEGQHGVVLTPIHDGDGGTADAEIEIPVAILKM